MTVNMQNIPVFYNGERDSCLEMLDTAQFISIFIDSAIYYFDNDSSLYAFCKKIGDTSVYSYNKKLDLIYEKAVEIGIDEKVMKVPEEMIEYWETVFGCPFGYMQTPELNNSKIPLVVNAFDGQFCQGSQKNCFGPTYYNLGNFNRRTSSFYLGHVSLLGGIFWCHRIWYGKPRNVYILTMSPFLEVAALPAQHDNKFCSYISTIH